MLGKDTPEDFRVIELSEPSLTAATDDRQAPHALYRLTKRNLGTLEALGQLSRVWRVPFDALSHGGLKDARAVTTQAVSIFRGPARAWHDDNLQVEYLGQVCNPFTSQQVMGNHFVITVRMLVAGEAQQAAQRFAEVQAKGFPNYFDEQRFGSVGKSGQFIAHPWCLGDYEQTIRLVLTEPHEGEPAGARREKKILRDRWGQWRACLPELRDPQRRRVVERLAQGPNNFRAAIVEIPHSLRSLYLNAFQSYLWNRLLAATMMELWPTEQLQGIPTAGGVLLFPRSLTDWPDVALTRLTLPLPSARLHLAEGPIKTRLDAVLAKEGIELRQLRVKYPRDTFFSLGDRPAWIVPREGKATVGADECYPGATKLVVEFSLPRGAYATATLKALFGRGNDKGTTAEDAE